MKAEVRPTKLPEASESLKEAAPPVRTPGSKGKQGLSSKLKNLSARFSGKVAMPQHLS